MNLIWSVYRPHREDAQTRSLCNVFVYMSTGIIASSHIPRDLSYYPSIASTMSQIPIASTSTSNYQSIFDNALEAYKKKTKKDLRSHPLLSKLETCDSPDAVLSVLRDQIPGFDQSRSTDERLSKWLNPTVNVLYTFSGTIGGAISSVNLGIQKFSR